MTRIAYAAAVPDTLARPGRWVAQAACQTDPDAMFPGKDAVAVKAAKQICARCPVVTACLRDALDTGDNEYGIRGGLRPDERRKVAKNRPAELPEPRRPHPKPAAKRAPVRHPPARTLAEAFAQRAVRTEDGHLLWYGAGQLRFQNAKYQALQVAFTLGHGREAEGKIVRTCGRACFRSDHLVDDVLREAGAMCGTRPGYQQHRKVGEEACTPCRRANTDADNRLRRTGTTKVAA
ncbi:WhiB family transcriptional regulator [Streptomyces acidiscabies]|uniref:WhiB family transcriptional regulator n=1 Tax=Streptomyces acidiscabies TaxID=42234 RepID=UPI0030CF2695